METVIITGMWIEFAFALIPLPVLLFLLIWKKRKKPKCAVILSVTLLIVELLLITLTTIQPPLYNASGEPLSKESVKTVRYVSNGKFNEHLPIFPVAVVVTENSSTLLRWRTYYSILGSTEHIWDVTNKCYECTDPLGH